MQPTDKAPIPALADPAVAPLVRALPRGDLPAGRYSVTYTLVVERADGVGETLPSPAASITLTRRGSIEVTIPPEVAAKLDPSVLAKVYLGASPSRAVGTTAANAYDEPPYTISAVPTPQPGDGPPVANTTYPAANNPRTWYEQTGNESPDESYTRKLTIDPRVRVLMRTPKGHAIYASDDDGNEHLAIVDR